MSTDRDDAFDALIDETARELTAGTSSARLRENVRARTRRAGRARTRRAGPFGPAGWSPFGPAGWRIPIWQPALGAAALAILTVALMLPDGQRPAVPALSENVPPRPEVGPPRVVARGSQPSGTVEQARPPGAGAGRQRVTAASNQVAVPPDPLPAIEPLAIEPVLMERTVIDAITAPMPLGIEQLEIERLFLE